MRSIREVFGAAYERQVAEMFEKVERRAKRGETIMHAPVTGLPYDPSSDEEGWRARLTTAAAMVACEKHRKSAPAWAQPLPVSFDELSRRLIHRIPRLLLRQAFAESLYRHRWDPSHPLFPPFACSYLADERAAREIRENDDLLQQFPPEPLVELSDPRGLNAFLFWLSPQMVARAKEKAKMREQP
jgi:hypothetical protein